MGIRIVLIHLGSYPPVHFWHNLEYLIRNHPNIGIDLILNCKVQRELLEKTQIRVFTYESTAEVDEVLDKQNNDRKFRNGFWRFSTERLFALAQHGIKHPEFSYLHIESDVLILPNFPFDRFQKMESLSWSRYDQRRDLASLVYIPNRDEAQWFLKMMHDVLSEHSGMNDMLLLNKIASRFANRVELLPTSPGPNSVILCERYLLNEDQKLAISRNYTMFEGIFDSAAVGIWLTGTDPRNYFGVRRKFSTEELLRTPTYIDPSQAQYRYSEGEGLFQIQGDLELQVFNLHIHSKDLALFGSTWESELEDAIIQSRENKVISDFSMKIFSELVLENWRKGTLISFIFWIPGIRQVRKLRFIKKLRFLR
jgi:hypothetical protein